MPARHFSRPAVPRRVATLSVHTSPLDQPGAGDAGGMNVYVRELVSSLAQAGVEADVFTRRWDEASPDVVEVEPALRSYLQPGYRANLADKIELTDEHDQAVELPDSNCLIVIERR